MKLLLNSVLFLSIVTNIHAQEILVREDFSDGLPSGWTVIDGDSNTPHEDVSEFTDAWIPFINAGDTVLASTSYYEPTGYAADYLITSKISLGTFSKLVWSAKSLDASYPDSYYVLVSTTDSLIGSFTDTIATISSESAMWNTKGIQLDLEGYNNQDIYISFKNVTYDGYILMIDDFIVYGSEFANVNDIASNTINLYPNPAQSTLYINSESPINRVNIYNTRGQIVLSSNQNEVSLNNLENGLYIVEAFTIDGIFRQQIVKN